MSVRIFLCVAVLVLAGGSAGAQTAVAPPPRAKSLTFHEAIQRLHVAGLKVELARSNLEQYQERSAWADRMVKKGFMSPAQGTAERLRLAEARIAYLEARANLDAMLCGRKPKQ